MTGQAFTKGIGEVAKPTTENFFASACTYLTRGWSVIPVYGACDPTQAKVAAVRWSAYKHSRCTAADVYQWCVERGYGGLAVVTGRISSLAVLDFDDRARFDEFQQEYPDLAETHTVETRRGVHLYFKIFSSVQVESRKVAGVDLQFDGRYVVAPPTVIDGHQYRVIRDTAPKAVNDGDIQCIYTFMQAIAQQNAPAPAFAPTADESDGIQLTGGDLVALYRRQATRIGRNNALFQASLRARDAGWPLEQVVACLANIHAHQPVNSVHHTETSERRYREAIGTIKSVFSRPACQRRKQTGQLSNSIRETLLKHGQTHTLRVIEGLQLRGVQPEQVFTYREAVQLLSGLVGQWSIRRALTALTPSGEPIFCPSPAPPTHSYADIEKPETQSKKMLMIRASKPTKNRRGRQTRRYFTMPDIYELYEKLGVWPSGSDTVAEADVRSASGYRQALHHKYIQRRPGRYPRSWLASRLGVSIRTEQRYNVAADIQVQAKYDSVLISWSNLNAICADFEVAGTFLQDERGKRYPARQGIAAHLLAQRRTVIYRRQRPNLYWCGDNFSQEISSPPKNKADFVRGRGATMTKTHLQEKPERQQARIRAHQADNRLSEAQAQPHQITSPLAAPLKHAPSSASFSTPAPPMRRAGLTAKQEPKSKRFYRKPLADSRLEALARQVHLETAGGAPNQRMSLCNARRLVDLYGLSPVETMLKRMLWLRKKGQIKSPSGFMVVASRVAWRVQNNAVELGTAAPRFRGEPARSRRRR